MKIYISVIIPTRQRHLTLKHTIASCLNQSFKNFEIIVCDNCSSTETEEVVRNFNDERICYVRTPELLSMTDNWEYALSFARGKYITILGDDDGLLDYSLETLVDLTLKNDSRIITWDRIYYSWPDIILEEYANRLKIPLNKEYTMLNSKKILNQVINYRKAYTFLPMVYNSLIPIDLINKIKKKNERFFYSASPDVYSGIIIASNIKEYLYLKCPMSISGGSGSSNGMARLKKLISKKGEFSLPKDINDEFKKLNEIKGCKVYAFTPEAETIKSVIYQCFIYAKDKEKTLEKIKINKVNIVKSSFEEIIEQGNLLEDPDKNIYIQKMIESMLIEFKENKKIVNWLKKKKNQKKFPKLKFIEGKGYIKDLKNNSYLILNADQFGCYNVDDVSRFCSKIIGRNGSKLEINQTSNLNKLYEIIYDYVGKLSFYDRVYVLLFELKNKLRIR